MSFLQAFSIRSRNRGALAGVATLHLLAGLLWMQQKRVVAPAGASSVSILLLRLAPRSAPSAPPAVAAQPSPAPASRTRRVAPQALPAPLPAPAPEAPAPSRSPAETADPFAPAPSASDFDADLLKRRSTRVTRAIAKELPPLPAEPDSRWARFRHDLEAAHVERGNGIWQDSTTTPDGLTVYRKHVGGRTFCRTSGSVGVLNMQLVKDAGEAGWTKCPATAQWKKEQ